MSKVDGSSSVMTMQGTQLRDALANHPAAQLAVIGEMENLSERPEDIQSRQICTDVMNYLETKIASIESQLHVGKISADQRGADEAYLDWHNRAVHALSMARLRYDRVRKQRHLLFLAEQDRNHQAHVERVAFADKTKAEARARNAEIQLETVKIAAERNVHKQVCRLVEQRFGKHVREELFEAAHQIVTHMKLQAVS